MGHVRPSRNHQSTVYILLLPPLLLSATLLLGLGVLLLLLLLLLKLHLVRLLPFAALVPLPPNPRKQRVVLLFSSIIIKNIIRLFTLSGPLLRGPLLLGRGPGLGLP